jgi:asparagine synthase (glutamine-hydrolysing)
MSVIFGICAPRTAIVDEQLLQRSAEVTARYGMDGTGVRVQGRIAMGFQAFHTNDRSRLEREPIVDAIGNILVLDGRLDNHQDLAESLDIDDRGVPDSALVLKAFERWGESCFSRLVGDWALALWSASDGVLYLARDHAGSRSLYYRTQNGETQWSSYLEWLFVDRSFPDIDREYVTRFLAYRQTFDLTPYKGIRAVPAAHYLTIQEGKTTARPHWRPIPTSKIVYDSEAEYDERFVQLFRQAVLRRIGPGAPILAELSGGMDSSSIVCMAGEIARTMCDSVSKLDTVSYYDDSEPDWDERKYFEAVERHCKRGGFHIDCSVQTSSYEPLALTDRVYPYPGVDRASLDDAIRFEESVCGGRYRVILSGIGGDELLGGVPTPMPELANHLRSGRMIRLVRAAGKWCIARRQPLFSLLFHTFRFTSRLYCASGEIERATPLWLNHEFLREQFDAPWTKPSIREALDALPSAIAGGRAWWSVVEDLPHLCPRLLGHYEYRYPYLDRDLVDFLHRIPREQLIQPGRRRLLMRRALKGIVPEMILERKRKAFISRGPLANLRSAQSEIEDLFSGSLLAEEHLIDRDIFLEEFRHEVNGGKTWTGHLIRTISMELWLKSLNAQLASLRLATASRRAPLEICPLDSGQTSSAKTTPTSDVVGAEICNTQRRKSCGTPNPTY